MEERGPDGFSISEACRAAGVSSAAPYRHFADKRDLLVATALDGMQRMRDELARSIIDRPQGTAESIATLGHVYVTFAQNQPGLFRLMFGLTKDHDKSEDMIDCGQESFGVLVGQVAICFDVPPDDPEAQRCSFELWTFVHGLAFLLIDDKVSKIPVPLSIPDLIFDVTSRLLKRDH